MIDLKGYKLALEESILISFLDINYMNELDVMEYEAFKIPYKHFDSNRVTKLISKAIFNLQELKRPFNDVDVEFYISSFTKFTSEDENNYLSLLSKKGFNFDTMKKHLEKLIEINEEIKANERINEI